MPPNLDVYAISRRRDAAAVERFVHTYVNREASEDRANEELMMLPLGATTERPGEDEWEWEPAHTLSHIIRRGLEEPPRAFAVYLEPRDPRFESAILGFTADGQLVAGVSLDDADESPRNLAQAEVLLLELARHVGAHFGFIGVEVPPPLLGAVPEERSRIIHIWNGEGLIPG